MPVKNVISKFHWEQGTSLNKLATMCGVSRQSITNICRRLGLRTRTIKEATKLTTNKGEKHYMSGKTKENCKLALSSSLRMKENNPTTSIESRTKAAKTRSKYFKKNLWPQERLTMNLLRSLNIPFISQHPIGPYIIDFFIPSKNLCLEIDSTSNWGAKRKRSAALKDSWLSKNGFKIIRIDKRLINKDLLKNVLDTYNVILEG